MMAKSLVLAKVKTAIVLMVAFGWRSVRMNKRVVLSHFLSVTLCNYVKSLFQPDTRF